MPDGAAGLGALLAERLRDRRPTRRSSRAGGPHHTRDCTCTHRIRSRRSAPRLIVAAALAVPPGGVLGGGSGTEDGGAPGQAGVAVARIHLASRLQRSLLIAGPPKPT